MGSLWCCLPIDDFERCIHPNNAINRHCLRISCFTHQFLNVYTSLFQRVGMQAVPSSIQGATPLPSITPSIDDSIPDTYRSPPRPLPYDFDPRCFHLQRDGRLSRYEKASSHPFKESEPLRSSSQSEPLGMLDKCNSSLMKYWSTRVANGEVFSSSEDEDVCPTCLEEYTPENPEIMTQCSHHFHLSCIYEWKERSESCPMCGKKMAIKETI